MYRGAQFASKRRFCFGGTRFRADALVPVPRPQFEYHLNTFFLYEFH
jgi:hypothetical protein